MPAPVLSSPAVPLLASSTRPAARPSPKLLTRPSRADHRDQLTLRGGGRMRSYRVGERGGRGPCLLPRRPPQSEGGRKRRPARVPARRRRRADDHRGPSRATSSARATRRAWAADGPQALELAGDRRPDLVILDLMLPGLDGLEAMRRLRALDEGSPAAARADHPADGARRGDRSRRRPAARRRRLRGQAVLAERAGGARGTLCCGAPSPAGRKAATRSRSSRGPMRIEPEARRAFVRGEEAVLTQREFDLLLFLVRHPGQVFSRDQLMDAVWQYTFYTDTSTVTVHIRRLRAKIGLYRTAAAPPDRVGRRLPGSSREPRAARSRWCWPPRLLAGARSVAIRYTLGDGVIRGARAGGARAPRCSAWRMRSPAGARGSGRCAGSSPSASRWPSASSSCSRR